MVLLSLQLHKKDVSALNYLNQFLRCIGARTYFDITGYIIIILVRKKLCQSIANHCTRTTRIEFKTALYARNARNENVHCFQHYLGYITAFLWLYQLFWVHQYYIVYALRHRLLPRILKLNHRLYR